MAIRILVASDQALVRSGLRFLLEKEEGIEVVGETGSGDATLKALNEVEVDVLLLEFSMPCLSGPQVDHEALKEFPDLAIVVLAMREDEYYLRKLLKTGVRAYVLQKSTAMGLIQAIRAAHRGNTYIDPALVDMVVLLFVGKPSRRNAAAAGILTRREGDVCRLLAYGHTNAEVAEQLLIFDRTVETHRTNIIAKLRLKNRAGLVRYAIDNGLLPVDQAICPQAVVFDTGFPRRSAQKPDNFAAARTSGGLI